MIKNPSGVYILDYACYVWCNVRCEFCALFCAFSDAASDLSAILWQIVDMKYPQDTKKPLSSTKCRTLVNVLKLLSLGKY